MLLSQKNFILTAGVIFFTIAVVHAVRITLEWHVVVDGVVIPMWVSYGASLVALLMALIAITLRR